MFSPFCVIFWPLESKFFSFSYLFSFVLCRYFQVGQLITSKHIYCIITFSLLILLFESILCCCWKIAEIYILHRAVTANVVMLGMLDALKCCQIWRFFWMFVLMASSMLQLSAKLPTVQIENPKMWWWIFLSINNPQNISKQFEFNLYHTMTTFDTLEEKAFWNHCGKRRKCW